MSTIDGSEIKNVTIDGAEVLSITMDGITVWQKLIEAGILRSVEVGDNLKGKTLYLGFPSLFFNSLPSSDYTFYDENNMAVWNTSMTKIVADVNHDLATNATIYEGDPGNGDIINLPSYTLSNEWSVVTSINASHPAYQYIKIIDDGLRNIEIGDDLSNKNLYFSFPDNLTDDSNSIIGNGNGEFSGTTINSNWISAENKLSITLDTDAVVATFYSNEDSVVTTNLPNYIMPSDYGLVTEVNKFCNSYHYIKIRKAPYYKNIEVGDNLSSANLYMVFPNDLYKYTPENFNPVIAGQVNGEYNFMVHTYRNTTDDFNYITINGAQVYDYYSGITHINLSEITLDSSYGAVELVDNTNPAYKYIFVKIRPIEVNDLLTSRNVYCNFPDNIHETISGFTQFVSNTAGDAHLMTQTSGDDKLIVVSIPGGSNPVMYYYDGATVLGNYASTGVGNYFGIVGSIDATNSLYQFVGMIDQSKLRHIEVGDNLDDRFVYFSFPDNFYEQITQTRDIVIGQTGSYNTNIYAGYANSNNRFICFAKTNPDDGSSNTLLPYRYYNAIVENNWENLHTKNTGLSTHKMGIVTTVNKAHPAYQYIWIMD